MATAALGLTSLGNSANDAASGVIEARRYRDQRALQQQLAQLRNSEFGLRVQEFQQYQREANQPKYLGHVPVPGGGVRALFQRPDGSTFTQDIVQGIDPKASQTGVDEILSTIPDEEGKKVGKAIHDGILASTGNASLAMKGLLAFQAKILEPTLQARGKFNERKAQGQAIGLKGADLEAYEAGATGATAYSFTPGGQRALRPPRQSAGAGAKITPPDEIEAEGRGVVTGGIQNGILGVPAKDRGKVLKWIYENGFKIPKQQSGAAKAKGDQAEVVQAQATALDKMLQDPDIQKWTGPVNGIFADMILHHPLAAKALGIYAKMGPTVVQKLQRFNSLLESYVNLQPALHGSRGVGMVKEFRKAVPGLNVPAGQIQAGIDAMADSSINFLLRDAELGRVQQDFQPAEGPDMEEEDVPPPEGAEEDQ